MSPRCKICLCLSSFQSMEERVHIKLIFLLLPYWLDVCSFSIHRLVFLCSLTIIQNLLRCRSPTSSLFLSLLFARATVFILPSNLLYLLLSFPPPPSPPTASSLPPSKPPPETYTHWKNPFRPTPPPASAHRPAAPPLPRARGPLPPSLLHHPQFPNLSASA